jgi:glycosyltransferase involved in cell wall biosynthesis
MIPTPLISVIIPVYNGVEYLEQAVCSVEQQDHRSIEILVVDDGSDDGTPDLIEKLGPRVRSFRQGNAGPSAARNTGIRAGRGEFVAFIDADDLWPEHKLDLQLNRFEHQPELDVVLGRIKYEAGGGAIHPEVRFENPEEQTVFNVHLGGGLYRRSAFERVGMLDETLRFSEDHDWFLRAREAGLAITIIPETTLIYRLHESNMTRGATAHDVSLARVMKNSLDRRRAAAWPSQPVPLTPWTTFDEAR